MQYRKLPNTDITLSAVTLGCMTFTGDSNWGPQEEKDSIATVRAALDAGITSYNKVTVIGTAASRVYFHLKAEAVRMRE